MLDYLVWHMSPAHLWCDEAMAMHCWLSVAYIYEVLWRQGCVSGGTPTSLPQCELDNAWMTLRGWGISNF